MLAKAKAEQVENPVPLFESEEFKALCPYEQNLAIDAHRQALDDERKV